MARKTRRLRQRDKFIIITNGKGTEKNYFTALRGYRRSIYDIKVEFENADPIGLINRAIREKESSNRVWIVFDKDEFSDDIIYETMRIAKQNDVGVAFSNIAFEVWLICHFKEFSLEKSADELIKIINSIFKDKGYNREYLKNDLESIRILFLPALDNARQNADISLQKRIAEFNCTKPNTQSYPYCDWNSCTTVHKLIDALKLETNYEENG